MLRARSPCIARARRARLALQVARAMVGLIQVAAYPVNHFPARGAVRDVVALAAGRTPAGAGFVATETLTFFGATLGIALACDDLGGCRGVTVIQADLGGCGAPACLQGHLRCNAKIVWRCVGVSSPRT